MKQPILSFYILVFVFSSCADSSDPVKADTGNTDSTPSTTHFNSPIGGLYSFGADPQTEPCGSLIIYPESDSTFLFYVDYTNGPPAFHMAQLAERGKIVKDTGFYMQEIPDEVDGCELKFYFKKDFVQIESVQRNCGFGANAIVDHVYDRKGSDVPQYYINPENDTVYFSTLGHALN